MSTGAHAAGGGRSALERMVDEVMRKVMTENDIPGMAVAITVQGHQYLFNYGVASKEGAQAVNEDTIFEIGSVSKPLTATLGAYAQAMGKLSLSDKASKVLPALAGSSFDQISLLDLGTYAAGGLPLQFPGTVTDENKMVAYARSWQPSYPPGTHRVYSNPSIGLFGHLAARSMGQPVDDLMERKLFPALGMVSAYLKVPRERMRHYAYGYSKDGRPVRVTPGVPNGPAYGVRTTATELIRFVEANLNPSKLEEPLRRAIAATQTGYYRVGPMVQGLGWEMYPYPVDLDRLLSGNSADILLKPQKVTRLDPPAPQANVLVNKTGSTNGFGAYVAFVPAKGLGIVMLANRNYPIPARVTAAHQILTALDKQPGLASAP